MHSIQKVFLITCLSIITYSDLFAQGGTTIIGQSNSNRIPIPAVPFLSIAPDARAAGMGDVGAATAPDAQSTFWNPAKLAFIDQPNGASLSYTPWLRNLIGDMSLSYLSGFYKIDKNSTVAATVNYFDLGAIEFTTDKGISNGTYFSKEFSAGVSYARKLNANIGVGVGIKYINSNLTQSAVINGVASQPGTTAAADISIYRAPNKLSGRPLTWAWGANISNLGGKVNYGASGGKYFIPANFRIGTSANYKKSAFNRLTVSLDMNKLMVPTPPLLDEAGKILKGKDVNDGTSLGRAFGSFGDAPDGFGEEFKEMTWSLGAEYAYKEQFLFRGGYFYENKTKGGRSYVTTGFGAKFSDKYTFDFAYLFQPGSGANGNVSPLSNTLRFTLGVFFDKDKKDSDDPNLN